MGLLAALAAPVRAETQAPAAAGGENGRFSMTPVANGFLRLDTRTGQTSLCTVNAGEAQCRAGADERAALDAEIDRLSKENAALKAAAPAASPAGAGRGGSPLQSRARPRGNFHAADAAAVPGNGKAGFAFALKPAHFRTRHDRR